MPGKKQKKKKCILYKISAKMCSAREIRFSALERCQWMKNTLRLKKKKIVIK